MKSIKTMNEKRYKAVPGHRVPHMKKPCKCGHRSTGYDEYRDFDEAKVHEGAKIEFEHTCDGERAERIAEDHIAEMGYGYYPELKKMEKKLLKENKGKEYMDDKRKPRTMKKCKPKKSKTTKRKR